MADTPTQATKPEADKEAARVVPALHPRFFQEAAHVMTCYVATTSAGLSKEDLAKPAFWAHVADKLRPWDEIRCIAEDGSYKAVVTVLSATRTDAQVTVDTYRTLQTVQDGEADLLRDYSVNHTPATNWRVVRKSDKRTVAEGLKNRNEAVTWIATNQRAAA
jgi:hypothetical protein